MTGLPSRFRLGLLCVASTLGCGGCAGGGGGNDTFLPTRYSISYETFASTGGLFTIRPCRANGSADPANVSVGPYPYTLTFREQTG